MAAESYDWVRMLDIGEASDVSPLIAGGNEIATWTEITTSPDTDSQQTNAAPARTPTVHIKQRWAYGTHETFDLAVSRPMKWTHILVTPRYGYQSNTSMNVAYVYRIDGAERVTKYDIPTGVSGSGNNTPAAAVRFTCTLDPLATVYYTIANNSKTFTLRGHWSRYPEPVASVREPFQVRPAQMKRSRSVELASNIPDPTHESNNTPYAIPYYNIATQNTGTMTSADIVWVEVNAVSNGAFVTWGTFCATNPNYEMSTNMATSGSPSYPFAYPALNDIINDPETYINVPASSIISIGVSVRCPEYAYWYTYNGIDSIRISGPALQARADARRSGYKIGMYNLYAGSALYRTSGEITLTDAEIMMGQVRILDVFDNPVAVIDTRYADPTTNKISYKITSISNGLGMSSVITLADGTEITFPEGTIPFNGSAYQEYAAAQLRYDREMLAMAQERVIVDTATGLTGSLVNGAIAGLASGGLGVGTGAVGMAGTAVNAYVSYTQNERTQNAKERLMKDTPDTVYNNAYGTEYIKKVLFHTYGTTRPKRGCIAVNMPDGVTNAELTQYCYLNGYPVTDYYAAVTSTQIVTLAEGFMRCDHLNSVIDTMPSNFNGFTGGQLRRDLEQQLKQGVHFKVIT